MALNVVSSDRLSTNVKTSNLATGLSGKVGENKNIIINGAMSIAQRGTTSTSSGYYTVDRFPLFHANTDEAPTQAQVDVASGTTPYTLGFRKALKITNGNQTSGAGANDYIWIQSKIEAQDIANSGWNYISTSSYITLSFWVKSSVAQTFKGYIETIDGTQQQYPFETGSLSADTWTKITKKIPGNANLTFDNNNNEGFKFSIIPFMGTDKTANSVTEDAWQAYASAARVKDNTTTWYTTNDATFELTGVQLEVGETATEFEMRSYGDELARCQRYFQIVGMGTSLCGDSNGATQVRGLTIPLVTSMRATPTIASGVTYHMWHGDNGGKNNDGTAMTVTAIGTTNFPSSAPALMGVLNGFTGNTDNRVVVAVPNTARMELSAEL